MPRPCTSLRPPHLTLLSARVSQFFPRGESVTTRICFRLRMHHRTAKELADAKGRAAEPSAVTIGGDDVLLRFEGDPNYVRSVEAVRARVRAENEKVQQAKEGVVDREIILNLYSSHFPDLTLVDLPGIIRARGPNDPKNSAPPPTPHHSSPHARPARVPIRCPIRRARCPIAVQLPRSARRSCEARSRTSTPSSWRCSTHVRASEAAPRASDSSRRRRPRSVPSPCSRASTAPTPTTTWRR